LLQRLPSLEPERNLGWPGRMGRGWRGNWHRRTAQRVWGTRGPEFKSRRPDPRGPGNGAFCVLWAKERGARKAPRCRLGAIGDPVAVVGRMDVNDPLVELDVAPAERERFTAPKAERGHGVDHAPGRRGRGLLGRCSPKSRTGISIRCEWALLSPAPVPIVPTSKKGGPKAFSLHMTGVPGFGSSRNVQECKWKGREIVPTAAVRPEVDVGRSAL
jgi:hypothetical protein